MCRKISAGSPRTLSAILKKQKSSDKNAKISAENKRFINYTRQVAKSLLPPIKTPNLTVSTADSFVSSESIIQDLTAKLAITDSDWAPWSYIGRRT